MSNVLHLSIRQYRTLNLQIVHPAHPSDFLAQRPNLLHLHCLNNSMPTEQEEVRLFPTTDCLTLICVS